MSNDQLQASQVKWKRLRRVVLTTTLIACFGGLAIYTLAGGSVLLDADGMVTRRSVSVASPWQDARVREVDVRPGDWVDAGQKIAVVESATMSRALAELSAERARVSGRLAQLKGRREVVKAMIPIATQNAEATNKYMETLDDANKRGMALARSMQQTSAAKVEAMDKLLTLEAEKTSLETEIASNEEALQQLTDSLDDLRRTYGNGVLVAPASGYIGSHVGMVGEVLSAGDTKVANIYTGPSYVLAYIPENYLFDVDEGQRVAIKGRGRTVAGFVERVLPVTEALPPEFQLPNRVRGRGQVVRVALSEDDGFAVDEKINVTSCHLKDCRFGVRGLLEAALPGLRGSKPKVNATGAIDPASEASSKQRNPPA